MLKSTIKSLVISLVIGMSGVISFYCLNLNAEVQKERKNDLSQKKVKDLSKMDIAKLDRYMAIKDPEKDLYWYNANKLTIEGKGWKDTESFYSRLPAKAKRIVRDPIWKLSQHTAGISIHFSTNSPSLAVKWDGFGAMSHMTVLGCSDLDLYVKYNGQWKWLAVGMPSRKLNKT